MNFNDNPEELKKEEQTVLDKLISEMNSVVDSLDERMKNYVSEAKNADISLNPDLYLARIMAQQGIRNTLENKRKVLQARDELYHTRLLLQYEDSEGTGVNEVKIGLHSYTCKGKQLVTAWTMPLCRHYILDNASIEYKSVVKDKYGENQFTNYKLLVKNLVTLRFTRVVKGINLYPGVFDDKTLKMMKGKGFMSDAYLDEMLKRFNADEYKLDDTAKIISDEFLQELLDRRSTPEFKNIVFSIQKKQGEIIQAPYKKNMIVQGCAGSGKSMIMLHRLPILLYDNPKSLSKNNLYIITPSQMYIQLAENMRYQLEISDINMGTIEQYYDNCIAKYPGHKAGEYGKINYRIQISSKSKQYIYSRKCIADITSYFDGIVKERIALDRAYSLFSIKEIQRSSTDTYAQIISNKLIKLQNIINVNNEVIIKYFKVIREVIDSLHTLSAVLRHRAGEVKKEITKRISKNMKEIMAAQKELKKLNSEDNAIAVKNRNNKIEVAKKKTQQLRLTMLEIEADGDYFASLMKFGKEIEIILKPFAFIKSEFSKNTVKNIYKAIDMTNQLIGSCALLQEISKIDDKYSYYIGSIKGDNEKATRNITNLQMTSEEYLEYDYYKKILKERDNLTNASLYAVKTVYKRIMSKLGIKSSENGTIGAIKCSPYIYLQVLYCYQGAPSSRESLLAIDEAQGIAPEEIRLLKNINGNNVVFNMYGDVYQHIEGTKGINKWDEYKDIIDFDSYEMLENYRNASQITDYCNQFFGMNMNPINTPGKGVFEITTESKLYEVLSTRLLDTERDGLAAILVSDGSEARKLVHTFPMYEQEFHDMTEGDFSIHHTRWNIINIDDAKGLEFNSVIVLSGRMSRNEKYIAFTRALDELYIYPKLLDVTGFEKKPKKAKDNDLHKRVKQDVKVKPKHVAEKVIKDHKNSSVRIFFEKNGMKVVDNRGQGGRLWVIGEKNDIKEVVNAAIIKFGISGKYIIGKEIKNKHGWCTKTDK